MNWGSVNDAQTSVSSVRNRCSSRFSPKARPMARDPGDQSSEPAKGSTFLLIAKVTAASDLSPRDIKASCEAGDQLGAQTTRTSFLTALVRGNENLQEGLSLRQRRDPQLLHRLMDFLFAA